jgi:hypothetical protein
MKQSARESAAKSDAMRCRVKRRSTAERLYVPKRLRSAASPKSKADLVSDVATGREQVPCALLDLQSAPFVNAMTERFIALASANIGLSG